MRPAGDRLLQSRPPRLTRVDIKESGLENWLDSMELEKPLSHAPLRSSKATAPAAGPDKEQIMIIARAPLRVSFLGGGTDYPEYFTEHEGEVLGTAIDKFSYITVTKLRELFEHTIQSATRRPSSFERPAKSNIPLSANASNFWESTRTSRSPWSQISRLEQA